MTITRQCRQLAIACVALLSGCSAGEPSSQGAQDEWACEVKDPRSPPEFLLRLGCQADFDALASEPLDSSLPGARSLKVVMDQLDLQHPQQLYFQDSSRYRIHYDFVSTHLSVVGPDQQRLPAVPRLGEFNQTEYYSESRRFLLGAVTYYEQPDVWALEISPYDTMSAAMIQTLFDGVKAGAFFGKQLAFHPTSEAVSAVAQDLSQATPRATTEELFAGTDYQPLNLGSTIGKLRFLTAAALETSYVGFRDIVVLDRVPNDISVVSGIITEEFQTPLSHINVLAQNRKTPNMGLREATANARLTALEGQWVKLTVGAFDWSVQKASEAEADAYWEQKKPQPLALPELDLGVRDLRNIEELVQESKTEPLLSSIQKAIAAFGTKASNYGVLATTEGVPVRKAFAIPVYYYRQFMEENGFFARVDALMAEADFRDRADVRDARLAELRKDMELGQVNAEFQQLLRAKLDADYPGLSMRFRTSTNAEDLDGFPCAGCYESQTGDPSDWENDLLPAIKKTWAGVWFFRTFEERAYHSIDHKAVGMALLVHHNFPQEEANGVALTRNPFDPSGLEPAFYVNVQWGGDAEVVHPPPGVTSDEFVYYWGQQKTVDYLGHSNLIPPGDRVLNDEQILELGVALDAIHARFSPAYGPQAGNTGYYAMDVEFKYDDEDQPDGKARLLVKQARPHPGRGQ